VVNGQLLVLVRLVLICGSLMARFETSTKQALHKSPFGFRLGRTFAVSLRLTERSYLLIEAMPQHGTV
jgi:hypothetical protein